MKKANLKKKKRDQKKKAKKLKDPRREVVTCPKGKCCYFS